MSNPYLEEIYHTLPRILGLFDTDISNPSFGLGDRFYWAWKLIDFPNATFQGTCHGLARLLTHDLLPPFYSKKYILDLINAIFIGTSSITRKNGSLEEAFPFEGSFCVTAAIAYDQLSTITLLKNILPQQKLDNYISKTKPLIQYLCTAEESHAFISNHLATAAAALYKWEVLTADAFAKSKADVLLASIIANQSEEGWYLEYEGADPGYQSLCTHYLADIYLMKQSPKLKRSLEQSLGFLQYFVHPDGSFGGIYGSRNTRFYYPGGISALASVFPEAKQIQCAMLNSINLGNTVTLKAMDEPNLIPMFNSYCFAATQPLTLETHNKTINLPCHVKNNFTKLFKAAGLLIDKGLTHYSIVSPKKGGVCYHFIDGQLKIKDLGRILFNPKKQYFSTQSYNSKIKFSIQNDILEISGPLIKLDKQLLTPIKLILLRIGNLTILRSSFFRELIKKLLVKLLITNKSYSQYHFSRKILLGPNLEIFDTILPNGADQKLQVIENTFRDFSVIHMASQGYWQKQDAQEI